MLINLSPPSFMNRRIEKLCHHCCGDGPTRPRRRVHHLGERRLAVGGWQLASIMAYLDRESVVSFLSGPTDFMTSYFTERAVVEYMQTVATVTTHNNHQATKPSAKRQATQMKTNKINNGKHTNHGILLVRRGPLIEHSTRPNPMQQQ